MNVGLLVGSGDRIGLFTLPFVVIGVALNVLFPSIFSVGGPPSFLKLLSAIVLVPGIANWIWSVALILTKVPRHELITNGPYAIVKHPLYTGVAFLVVPWIGFFFDTWLGAAIGIVLYVGSRRYSPLEETTLAKEFGSAWDDYCRKVAFPSI